MNKSNKLRVLNKLKPLYVSNTICLSYYQGKLYYHDFGSKKINILGYIPMSFSKKYLSRFRIVERLFRFEPRISIKINDKDFLISYCGKIYFIDIQNKIIRYEHKYRKGMNNPLNFCNIKDIDGFQNCIAYGEYFSNNSLEEIAIYCRYEGIWKKVNTFERSTIKHIHGLIANKYNNTILILTGDKDNESGFWEAKDNFKIINPLFIGKQKYRSCVAFPLKDGILYATDTPLEDNFIFFVRKVDNEWKEECFYNLPGPCIYGCKLGNTYVFSTSVEPDSSISETRYLFTNHLGQGVKNRFSHVIVGNILDGFKEIAIFRKDSYPMVLFQFGNVQFPSSDFTDKLIMYPVAVRNFDGKTVLYEF